MNGVLNEFEISRDIGPGHFTTVYQHKTDLGLLAKEFRRLMSDDEGTSSGLRMAEEYSQEMFEREVVEPASVLQNMQHDFSYYLPPFRFVWEDSPEGHCGTGFALTRRAWGQGIEEITNPGEEVTHSIDQLIEAGLRINLETGNIAPDIFATQTVRNIIIGTLNPEGGNVQPYFVDVYPLKIYRPHILAKYEGERLGLITQLLADLSQRTNYNYPLTNRTLTESGRFLKGM